jgi:outer membrane protein OmpA-like peptidoglycan-associated protein
MRWGLLALAAIALAGCASTDVTLLDGEDGADAGSVVVLDRKKESERGVLDRANTKANTGGMWKMKAKNAKTGRYEWVNAVMPAHYRSFTLYFPEGSTELTPESETVFRDMLEEVARRPGAEVNITGNTDTVDDQDVNDRLSRRRAQEIATALQAKGLDLSITRIAGRGERELLVPTPDNTPEPQNRRVVITVR